LLYPPLPGATGTELGSTSVAIVVWRIMVVLMDEVKALVPAGVMGGSAVGELVRVLLLLEGEEEVELQVASPCATGKGLPESG